MAVQLAPNFNSYSLKNSLADFLKDQSKNWVNSPDFCEPFCKYVDAFKGNLSDNKENEILISNDSLDIIPVIFEALDAILLPYFDQLKLIDRPLLSHIDIELLPDICKWSEINLTFSNEDLFQKFKGQLYYSLANVSRDVLPKIILEKIGLNSRLTDFKKCLIYFPSTVNQFLVEQVELINKQCIKSSVNTTDLLEVYMKLTHALVSLDDVGNFVYLNKKILEELTSRADCTQHLAKYLFKIKLASEKENLKNEQSQIQRKTAQMSFRDWLPLPKNHETTFLQHLLKNNSEENDIVIFSSLFKSNEQFAEEMNKVVQKHIMQTCLDVKEGNNNLLFSANHPNQCEYLKNLSACIKRMETLFPGEKIDKCNVMIQDIIKSWQFTKQLAEKMNNKAPFRFLADDCETACLITSHEYWPRMTLNEKTFSPPVLDHQHEISSIFESENRQKKILYQSSESKCLVEVSLGDEPREYLVTPDQLGFLSYFNEHQSWDQTELCNFVGVDKDEMHKIGQFWINNGVISFENDKYILCAKFGVDVNKNSQLGAADDSFDESQLELFAINFHLVSPSITGKSLDEISQFYCMLALDELETIALSNVNNLKIFLDRKIEAKTIKIDNDGFYYMLE